MTPDEPAPPREVKLARPCRSPTRSIAHLVSIHLHNQLLVVRAAQARPGTGGVGSSRQHVVPLARSARTSSAAHQSLDRNTPEAVAQDRWKAATFLPREPSPQNTTTEAGLLAPGSSYWPRLPTLRTTRAPFEVAAEWPSLVVQWPCAAVVPGYSGGTATDLHRFPYSSRPATSRRDTSCQASECTARSFRVKSRPRGPKSHGFSRNVQATHSHDPGNVVRPPWPRRMNDVLLGGQDAPGSRVISNRWVA